MKPVNLSGLPTAQINYWEIGTEQNPISGGVNYADLEYMLADNQSPKMENMWYDGRVLGKRPGQAWAAEGLPELLCGTAYGSALIVATGDGKLLKVTFEGSTPETAELYTGMTGGKGTFFTFGGRLYYLNGKEYLVYDGATCEEVEPYAPNIIINRPPNGEGGDLTDNYNRLGGAFRNTFNGDGESKVYQLTDTELDDGICEVVVDGKQMESGWTVDYKTGKVTFTTAPSKGTNNVEITVSKLDTDMRENLLACTAAAVFGGTNGTRVFLAGNGTATYFYSDLTSPDYFPENNYNVVGDNTPITALALQYGVLIVFKESEVWQVSYSESGGMDGRVSFPLKAVNRGIGCDCPGSVQLVNNSLVWLSSKVGVCILCLTQIEDERNVQVISRNIMGTADRPGLLQCEGLHDATSADWRGKYWLRTGERVWVWDYEATPYQQSYNPDLAAKALAWFPMTGITAGQFLILPEAGGLGLCYLTNAPSPSAASQRPAETKKQALTAVSADFSRAGSSEAADGVRGVIEEVRLSSRTALQRPADTEKQGWETRPVFSGSRAQQSVSPASGGVITPSPSAENGEAAMEGRVAMLISDYRDFDEGYRAIWRMPVRGFNLAYRLKTVVEMWVTVRTDTNTRIQVRYITDEEQNGVLEEEPILASSFSWRTFAWDTFTWRIFAFARTFRRKPKKKKIQYFAVEFENSDPGRDLNISGVTLSWRIAKKVKY